MKRFSLVTDYDTGDKVIVEPRICNSDGHVFLEIENEGRTQQVFLSQAETMRIAEAMLRASRKEYKNG